MNTDKKNTLLLIESDADDAKLILDALDEPGANHFDVEWVGQLSDGLRLLGKGGIGLVVLALDLPDSQGLATFDRLFATAPDLPILIFSRSSEASLASEAIQRGAYDYLMKDHLDKYTLTRTLRHAIEHKEVEEVLLSENERAHITLNAIGDAVLSTDISGNVAFLNPAAESMTGWSRQEALGRPLAEVLQIIDGATREPLQSSLELAIRQNHAVGLSANATLIRRGGSEFAIEDSTTLIRNSVGTVAGAVIVFRDVSAARAMTLKMSHLAQHDFLTGLPNRMLLADRIQQAISSAKRSHEQLAVLFLDLDRFKNINDSMGHLVGDQLLQSVAQRLVACARESDTVSRQGGDEFVILLPRIAHAEDAAISVQKILSALSAPYDIAVSELHIQASVGISTYPRDGQDAETLLKGADHAMYSAKDNGRNNFEFFRGDMSSPGAERQSLENPLRLALKRHEFLLHYQPRIDLRTGEINGVEALVRWLCPGRGLVPPAQFVPLAEDCGLMVPIGQWILREACTQLGSWLGKGLPPVSMAVNLSAAEFRAADLPASVSTILHETGIEPRFLEFDLPENALMKRVESATATLRALSELGVQLTIDNFGTGYSSLGYLNQVPINALKIDGSFIREIGAGTNDAPITTAVIHMARSMKQRVIAEGVETREQRNFLQLRGCGEGQGYYFSRPVPAPQCAELLRAGIAESVL
jgi:diguanylate cyclase (GGDEF)-like protein/PAS domain S-box-containing protein